MQKLQTGFPGFLSSLPSIAISAIVVKAKEIIKGPARSHDWVHLKPMGSKQTIEGGIGPGKDHVEKGIKGREPNSATCHPKDQGNLPRVSGEMTPYGLPAGLWASA